VIVDRGSGSQYRLAKASYNVPEANKSYRRTIRLVFYVLNPSR
jgi:hypothetical protein